jgi:hypothetical protein
MQQSKPTACGFTNADLQQFGVGCVAEGSPGEAVPPEVGRVRKWPEWDGCGDERPTTF